MGGNNGISFGKHVYFYFKKPKSNKYQKFGRVIFTGKAIGVGFSTMYNSPIDWAPNTAYGWNEKTIHYIESIDIAAMNISAKHQDVKSPIVVIKADKHQIVAGVRSEYYNEIKKVAGNISVKKINKFKFENMNLSFKNIIKEVEGGIDYSKYYPQRLTYFKDIPIKIENEAGSMRLGYDKKSLWQNVFDGVDYGYIPYTKTTDDDEIDVFIGEDEHSDKVFIIKQNKEGTDQFDELKCMLGFLNKKDAKKKYFDQYNNAKDIFDSIQEIPLDEFKKFIVKNIKKNN